MRANNTALTEAQDAEEAHLRARFDAFAFGPESTAHRRRQVLQDAERQYKKHRFFGDFADTVPLSSKDKRDLEFLRWIYSHRSQKRPNLRTSFWKHMATIPSSASCRRRTEIYTRGIPNCGRQKQLTICRLG